MIYLDASAIVTYVLGRRYDKELAEYLGQQQGKPTATSTIGLVEAVRNCDKHGSFPTLMSELRGQMTELLVTDEIRDLAAQIPERLRAMDAIHVATAESIGEFLTAVVSYDERMLKAAHARGLPIAHPGMPR
ncbi:hypothetical protein LX16_3935 [Stackebrandtia albiflava]|uniref:PIN domain-containing protein n=1 Tax=Stackebrandtia albiflava TaxID=406432 RepID=A0A562UY79_9ACTN|nr:type II toxin-antitoxin system VapC family toxin [Stackebrandtia albiflava]TWJ10518.1 hypothetical protein LX16_3935 [Stackebrandtia albiflava]